MVSNFNRNFRAFTRTYRVREKLIGPLNLRPKNGGKF
jgi:hypothetical protein